MTDPDIFFKDVLKALRPLFRDNGFRSSSQNFLLESSECWAIVNFQKSRWSEPHEKTFYLNASITAKISLEFDGKSTNKAPAHFECIWNIRAEQLGPDPKIQSWTVSDAQSAAYAVQYLKRLLGDFVIPALKLKASVPAILEMWRNDADLGYQQLKAKSVLLAAQGKINELEATLKMLQERFGNGVVQKGVVIHIKLLREAFPDAMSNI